MSPSSEAGSTAARDAVRRKTRFFRTPADLRRWFRAHHDSASELWIGYYKVSARRAGVTYEQAVEEALCFGWIDGQVRSLDELRYANRYSPRKEGSPWSETNLRKVTELESAGRMHAAGRAAYVRALGRSRSSAQRVPTRLSPELRQTLRAQANAWEFFRRQPPSYREWVERWVMSARRPSTRADRCRVLVLASGRQQRLDPLRPGRTLDGRIETGALHSR